MVTGGRRSSPPNIDLPAKLADHVDAAAARVCRAATEAVDLPATAAGALSRIEAARRIRGVAADVEDRLLVWCLDDAQVSVHLVAEALGIHPTSVGRSARRARSRLGLGP